MSTSTQRSTQRAVETVFRIEFPRLVAGLTRMLRDVGAAEELAQDALVVALEHWPSGGIPDNPGAWLMAHAKRRAIDQLRRNRMLQTKHQELGHAADQQERAARDVEGALDEDVGDDLLRLLFISCHPVLPREARIALTLRLLGGLTTDEIARAFLSSEPTIAQRIVRAKRTLADAQVPFELPPREELASRLSSVLEVIYLVFNEGYSATSGDSLLRPSLCEDAMRLCRVLTELAGSEPEVHGLLALMEIQASRARARVGPGGEPILLLDQDRARWDHLLIRRGLEGLARADALTNEPGPYHLQAAIAACHARARVASETDWIQIATLYAQLARITPSPVVDLNRAVAVSMAFGPAAALPLVDALMADGDLAGYHLLPSVRGDLLAKLGRNAEARAELLRAAELTRNERERDLLRARAATLEDAPASS